MKNARTWVTLTCLAYLTFLPQAYSSPPTYCPKDMTAQEQEAFFSRAVVLGASFSHGCSACDVLPNLRAHYEASDDSHWVRRHPIVQFYLNYSWKNHTLMEKAFVHIVENEIGPRRPSMVIPAWQLKGGDYYGQWVYFPREDALVLPRKETRERLMNNPDIAQDAALVGGAPLQRQVAPRNGSLQGALYQFITPQTGPGQPPLSIFDLSKDGSTLVDVFKAHVPAPLFKSLYDRGWSDGPLRDQAVEALAQRIISLKPTLVLAPDALFWDSIALALANLQQENPSNVSIKIMMRALDKGGAGRHHADPLMRENIKTDYLRALARVAQWGPGIPVFVGQLLDDPIKYFESGNMAPFIGAALVQFLESMTGIPLPSKLLETLTQKPITPEDQALLEKFQDLPYHNGLMQAAVQVAIGTILRDQQLLMKAFNNAFNDTNVLLHGFAASHPHTIKVLDFNAFYKDFVSFLKPETFHPTVAGAQRMGALLEPGMCLISQDTYDQPPAGHEIRIQSRE